ncbi:MAG: hypothetical protein QOF41_981 [Methylobacteriaceae bacterium]|nr:hypothetical protein [Methylobacteriaceae bacterium]
MDETWVKIVVGIGAGIVGALLAAGANALAAHLRIREVKLTYEQQLRSGYLENARKVSEEVYIPLAVATSKLWNSYDNLRSKIDFEVEAWPVPESVTFIDECRTYLSVLEDLSGRGAEAYLTNDLDVALQNFVNFLRRSLQTEVSVRNEILTTTIPITVGIRGVSVPINVGQFRTFLGDKYKKVPSTLTQVLDKPFSLGLAGFNLSYRIEVLAAPIGSRDFERRMVVDISVIKTLIKEVTLGSRSGN